jgi:hypothetical protein
MTTNVASDYYIWDNTVKHFGPTGTVDFSNIRDSLGIFEARFVTVFLNGDTSELNYLTGEIFDNTVVVTDPTEFISVPGANEGIPLAAIYLFNSMTQVLWKDIFDIRQIIQSVGGSGGGSGVNWANVIIVAVSGGDHTTITAGLAAASSGDIVLVMPGTYTEAITLVAGVTVIGLGNSTAPFIIAPAAGSPVTIPSGAGAYRLHNCTLTPPSGITCVTDNMGASGIAKLYRVSIGTAGGGDSIDSSGGNAAATLTLEECRISGNFTQFSTCDFIDTVSSSSILPAASAGDLTLYGGEVGGNITHVSGQTVAYLNTPFIGGAVTGNATEFGNYTDGVNDFEVTGDVVIQSGGGLYVPDLFDGGFNIPFVSASNGLFSSSTQLLWTGVAVAITNEGASSPRGIHVVQYSNTASVAPQWTASRARGTLASPTAVQSGDKLGEFRFRGFDTLFTDTVAQIAAHASENFVTGSNGTYVTISTTPDGSETLTEAVRIDNAGQLQLPVTGGNAGILMGGDVPLFRVAANTLQVGADDGLVQRLQLDGLSVEYKRNTNDAAAIQYFYTKSRLGLSANDNDNIVDLSFAAFNSADVRTTMAKLQVKVLDVTDTTEDARIDYQTIVAGASASRLRIEAGIQIGSPTGGDKGTGTINVATDIYKNNTAYTNPDHVLEHWATGRIKNHLSKQSQDYDGLMALDDLRIHLQEHFRLPRITDEPMGIFERGDTILEKVEELTLYILQLHDRIRSIEH